MKTSVRHWTASFTDSYSNKPPPTELSKEVLLHPNPSLNRGKGAPPGTVKVTLAGINGRGWKKVLTLTIVSVNRVMRNEVR